MMRAPRKKEASLRSWERVTATGPLSLAAPATARASGRSSERAMKMKDPAPTRRMMAVCASVSLSPSDRMTIVPSTAERADKKLYRNACEDGAAAAAAAAAAEGRASFV